MQSPLIFHGPPHAEGARERGNTLYEGTDVGMNLILIGMNHKTAPLAIREKLSLSCLNTVDPLAEMMKIPHVQEAMYLSTCNRVEVLANAAEGEAVLRSLKDFIFHHGNLPPEELEKCLYVHFDHEAVRHLFRVASSIDSLVMGEPQILGQVKDAYNRSVEQKATGIILNKVLHHAFRVAKRVRTETAIAGNAVSVSYAAVQLAKKIFGDLKKKTVMLIGAGEMSELTARHLLNNGVSKIMVANRTHSRAVQLAAEFNGTALEFDRLGESLRDADIVISSTGAPGYVITREMVEAALQGRKKHTLFLIDIAVPRDVDPEVGDLDNVYLYNVDDLQEVVDENMKNRRQEALKAAAIIDEEVEKHRIWRNSLAAVPAIVSLRDKTTGIIKGELERCGPWLKGLGEKERESVEMLANAIVNKIIHDPIVGLKEESQDSGETPYVVAFRRLFKLDDT